jgi:uncharacterized membrane protein YfcA
MNIGNLEGMIDVWDMDDLYGVRPVKCESQGCFYGDSSNARGSVTMAQNRHFPGMCWQNAVLNFSPYLTIDLLYAGLAVFTAGMVRGFSGFGSAMVMTPSLAALYGPTTAVPLALILDLVLAGPMLRNALRQIEPRRIGVLTAAAMVGVPIGTYLLLHLQAQTLRVAMSMAVLSAVLLLVTGWRHKGAPHLGGTIATGLASGAMNSAIGMGGPPVIFYFLSGSDAAAKVRASLNVYFALVDIGSLVVLAIAGQIGGSELIRSLLLLPPLLLGLWVGTQMFHRGGDRFYRPIAIVILAGVAAGSLLF